MKTSIYNIKQFFSKNTLFQILIFSTVALATLITTYQIYQDVKQIVAAAPAGTVMGCLFDVMH